MAALAGARGRSAPKADTVKRFAYSEPVQAGDADTVGGLSVAELAALGGTDVVAEEGPVIRFAEAVRRTLASELEANPKVLVFGEDVGVKGGVHLVTEGLQQAVRERACVRYEPLGRRASSGVRSGWRCRG